MSRIGKQPIPVPAGVDVTIEGQSISVKGPKGTLGLTVAEPIKVARNDDGAIVVTRPDDERRNRSLHGLSRTLVSNLVTGVTQGYTTKMEIFGVGYRVQLKGSNLEFALGYSHPVVIEAPEGITFAVQAPTKFTVSGIDKQKSARSPPISAVFAVPIRTRARACATRASRSAARSERQVSSHGAISFRDSTNLPPAPAHAAAEEALGHRGRRGWWCIGPRGTSTCNW